MIYSIEFHKQADKEFKKIDGRLQRYFGAVLKKISEDPENFPHKALGNHDNSQLAGCYKIKAKASGYRLVYEIFDKEVRVYVLAVGKRDKDKAYKQASQRRLWF